MGWHKWPDEKPESEGDFLVKLRDDYGMGNAKYYPSWCPDTEWEKTDFWLQGDEWILDPDEFNERIEYWHPYPPLPEAE